MAAKQKVILLLQLSYFIIFSSSFVRPKLVGRYWNFWFCIQYRFNIVCKHSSSTLSVIESTIINNAQDRSCIKYEYLRPIGRKKTRIV